MRKQAAITLRCMQALVRVQARVRARRVRLALESQTEKQKLQQQLANEARVKEIEVSNFRQCQLDTTIIFWINIFYGIYIYIYFLAVVMGIYLPVSNKGCEVHIQGLLVLPVSNGLIYDLRLFFGLMNCLA